MKWKLDKERPLCPQISEQLCVHIAKGEFAPNEKLLSVRDIAVAAGVNPNTVQRALDALEEQGILYSVRGSGWYVAEDITFAKETMKRLQRERVNAFFEDMKALGMSEDATKHYVKEWEL